MPGDQVYRWPFRPASMHIHPLTRFVREPGATGGFLLEARIEFLDDWEDPTKSLGDLTLELSDRSGGRPLLYGNLDLNDLARNAQQYDTITFTYVMRLRPEWENPPRPGDPIRLKAFLLSPDGEKYQAQYDIPWPSAG